MSEMTAEQKLDLIIVLAKQGKEALEAMARNDERFENPVNQGSAIGIRASIKAFENVFNLVGYQI